MKQEVKQRSTAYKLVLIPSLPIIIVFLYHVISTASFSLDTFLLSSKLIFFISFFLSIFMSYLFSNYFSFFVKYFITTNAKNKFLKRENHQKTHQKSNFFMEFAFKVSKCFQLPLNHLANSHFSLFFCVAARFLDGVLMLSSSFIEEEHQLEYFFLATLLFLKLIDALKPSIMSLTESSRQHSSSFSLNLNRKVNGLEESLYLLLTMMLMKVAKCWNQTGDKWKHLEDVGDWLNRFDI